MSKVVDICDQHLWPQATKQYLQDHFNSSTERLDLQGNHLDDFGIDYIIEILNDTNCQLLSINLSETGITNDGAIKLFNAFSNTKIKEIILDNLILSEDSINALSQSIKSMPEIELLSISGSDLSFQSIVFLASSLPSVPSLHYLRLESNSMYESGLNAISDVISQTNIISIEIADNQIWTNGMSKFLQALLPKLDAPSKIQHLDISFNAVDLQELSELITRSPQLKGLAVSGCRVEEKSVIPFFESIKKSNIKTLICDTLSFSDLPFLWPKNEDNLFRDPSIYESFKDMINNSALNDIRIGFLDLNQLCFLKNISRTDQVDITFQNFGKSQEFWILHLPDFILDMPSDTFNWCTIVPLCNAENLSILMKSIDSTKLRKIYIENSSTLDSPNENLIASFKDCKEIDSVIIKMSQMSFSTLGGVLKLFVSTKITTIDFSSVQFEEPILCTFFSYLKDRQNAVEYLKNLSFGIKSPKSGPNPDIIAHDMFPVLDEFLTLAKLETLHINGTVSPVDVKQIISCLGENKFLYSLEIDSVDISRYKEGPIPLVTQESTHEFMMLCSSLLDILKRNNCFSNLKYQLLEEIFCHLPEICSIWKSIEILLNENLKNKVKS